MADVLKNSSRQQLMASEILHNALNIRFHVAIGPGQHPSTSPLMLDDMLTLLNALRTRLGNVPMYVQLENLREGPVCQDDIVFRRAGHQTCGPCKSEPLPERLTLAFVD